MPEWRTYLTAAAFDRPPVMGRDYVSPTPLVAGCRAVDAPGVAGPFGYLTDEDRRAVWAAWPSAAPPEVRDRRARADRAVALVATTTATGTRPAVVLTPAGQDR